MRIFWVTPSNRTVPIANRFGGVLYEPVKNEKLTTKEFLPDNFKAAFDKCDTLVVNGTWGGERRKAHVKPDLNYEGKIASYIMLSSYLDMFNQHLVSLAKEQEKKIISIESPTISRCLFNNFKNHSTKSHVRMSLDHWTWGQGKFIKRPDPEFPQTIANIGKTSFLNHTWRNNKDGNVLIIGGLPWDPTSTIEVEDFIEHSIKQIKLVSDRPIVVKVHPGCKIDMSYITDKYDNVTLLNRHTKLQSLYKDTYAAVIDNSTSCFELLEAGIPVFCSPDSFCEGLGNLDVSKIERPYYAEPGEVVKWANTMSMTEFSKSNHNSMIHYFEKLLYMP